ncbi:4-hydroxy-3-methylbut-2-enyl diphosphate reductase [Syntrophobacter fumaroxidans]|uniref:4-hydroxy-3-methylbut-2-enyl diphosphate reductase n=1 Tax=Syntrophobacter fumaroxidans (strain DSM 10017 / MPOB) TaxID=335543 RepID=A0LJ95_SYNFM|nr:4-hydroxy-3-methylbut-2-enyl diphosphate reductase [Syntrophobacter fumaroxidans]ABK17497.1 hydroxymethylbutenyl pyrophosphate reductase [Syntrophobacter fumaroxidans MPOB]
MKVLVAKTAGFCKGVRDALEVTLGAIKNQQDGENICTFGPLIHNRQVLAMLEAKGIREVNEIEGCADRKVVIRAHGIPPETRQTLHRLGATLLDATCKRVAKVHAAIKRHARRGYYTVIVGDADHAEVIGLMGYTEGRGVVINRVEQLNELPAEWENVLLVAQTTQNEEVFQEIQEEFLKKYPKGKVKNTICDSTHERQTEVREMCSLVEAMVIVGGFHSGNTLRLAQVARECEIPTYHVETEAELNPQELAKYSRVGVSAGASTPNWLIRNVVRFLESIRPEQPEPRFSVKKTLELLAYANFSVALGAALLSAAAQALSGLPGSWTYSLMAACYVYAMHSLNIFLDRNAIQLNDPRRAEFYERWRLTFMSTSTLAVVLALGLALAHGFLPFAAMVVLVLLGSLYAVPLIIPAGWRGSSVFKIKDIPTSKTFFVPIAWACVIVLVPHLWGLRESFGPLVYASWVVFLMVLIRTTLLDLIAVQGDRIVGKETLVVLMGEVRTSRFTNAVFGLLSLSLLLGPVLGLASWFAWALIPAVAAYWWYLHVGSKRRLKEDPVFESYIEFMLIGSGALGMVWNLAAG